MVSTGPSSSASPECPVCQLPLAQTPQLHSQQHPCPFCDKVFARVDTARRHAKTCPRRGSRSLPPQAKRGRKLRACDQCSRIKVQCDGKMPCGHCASRHQDCTFNWVCSNPSHRQTVSQPRGARRLPLDFLVAFTDPNRDFVTEQQVAEEPESHVQSPPARVSPQPLYEVLDCIDPMRLFAGFVDPYLAASLDEYGNYTDHVQDALGPSSLEPPNDHLEARLSLLASELHALSLEKSKFRGTFDIAAFNDLFSSTNIHQFALTFSRKRHYQSPIIHWPTFDLEVAPLPLLLAVALTGAAYSHRPGRPPNFAFRAREFHCISGAYIFKHLRHAIESANESLELCQAGLLSFAMDACVNDDEVRRIAVTKRLPTLVTALRRFNLTGKRHDASEYWHTFIQKEKHIRLTSWVFYVDTIITLFTNSPPRMSLSEMNGHLPCSAELWDAETSDDYQRQRLEEEHGGGLLCVRDLVSGLMAEEWPGVESMPYSRLHFRHLHAVMCAFQPIIYNMHTSLLPSNNAPVILRALSRWNVVWDTSIRYFPAYQRKWMGLARNALEVSWLSRKIVELNETEEGRKLAYLRRIPGYNAEAAHEFISALRSNSALT